MADRNSTIALRELYESVEQEVPLHDMKDRTQQAMARAHQVLSESEDKDGSSDRDASERGREQP